MTILTSTATDIASLATAFDTFKGDIDGAIQQLGDVNVVAGDFAEATTLVNTVTNRTTELNTNLTGLSKALETISTNLNIIATNVTSTDDQNKLTADALNDLVNGLDTDLPGFEDK